MPLLTFLFHFLLWTAQADDIQEATGLPDETAQVTAPTGGERPAADAAFRYRAYLLLEGISRTEGSVNAGIPNIQASLAFDYKSGATTFFFDGVTYYVHDQSKNYPFLNQLGARYELGQHWLFAAGKERSRRAPGIVVAPSDLLFSQAALPGLREDRRGVWLARATLLAGRSSVDFLVLPFDRETAEGLPASGAQYRGEVVRGYILVGDWDFSLSLGRLDETARAGASAQTIFSNTWKLYSELGYFSETHSLTGTLHNDQVRSLTGVSFEGDATYSARVEYFYNGPGSITEDLGGTQLSRQSSVPSIGIFPDRHYAILTAAATELKDRVNLIASSIASLEGPRQILLLRAEYLATDHLVLGSTCLLKEAADQYGVDLKYSF